MNGSHVTLTRGAIWTTTFFVISQIIRFSTNVILTRLLAPELFGVMIIVNTLRTGVELLSDVGVAQSIVQNKRSEDPDFYNTAWTLTAIRGVFLWLITCFAAVPASYFYHAPSLLHIIPIATLVLILSGLTPPSQFFLQKRMQFVRLGLFGLINLIAWATSQVALAYFFPTIWALVFGLVLGSVGVLITSFFMVPAMKWRFTISTVYVSQILHFGKWIFLTSMVFFISTNFDRIYFARVIPLSLLGIYGISRTISELMTTLAIRLGNGVVFPFIASHQHLPRLELREQLTSIRLKFLLISALGFSVSAAFVDLAIKAVFDQRYQAASWMVPILIIGAWISVLCNLNEATLLGLGRPSYAAIGSSSKFIWLLAALPFGFAYFGFISCIVAIAVSDISRYFVALVGQARERLAFGIQDLLATAFASCSLLLFELARWSLGFGTSFDTLPKFH